MSAPIVHEMRTASAAWWDAVDDYEDCPDDDPRKESLRLAMIAAEAKGDEVWQRTQLYGVEITMTSPADLIRLCGVDS